MLVNLNKVMNVFTLFAARSERIYRMFLLHH